jgi:Nitroreductase family
MCRSIQFALSVKKDEPWHRTSRSWLARYICATRRDKEANRGATQPAGFPSKDNPGNRAVCLSLGQDLAGNSCVTFSMIGDLDRAARTYGDRGYRHVHFEAGAIGHHLYLAAEAFGFGATGIGAFYDDEVHRYLALATTQGQVVYHFAIGYPVPDPRLSAPNVPRKTTYRHTLMSANL